MRVSQDKYCVSFDCVSLSDPTFSVEKFLHFILGKHMFVKVPLPIVKFLLS
jgi:hypothetical protein